MLPRRRSLEVDFDGHEVFWASADDTTVDEPGAELAAEVYPDAAVRSELDGCQEPR